MSEAELLTRAREAYVATHRPPRWLTRFVRAGYFDWGLRVTMTALRDLARPVSLIVADRDEATVAQIMRMTPGLPQDRAIAAALLTAVRLGRRG
jgi:hypothetical protein